MAITTWIREFRASCSTMAAVGALALSACQTSEPEAVETAASEPSAAIETTAVDGAHAGEAVYQQYCAACHDQPEATRSPAKDTLEAMSFQFLNYALTEGKMKVQGASLSDDQRGTLINYLTGRDTTDLDSWTEAMMCPADRRAVDLSGAATVTNFGFSRSNAREMTAEQAGLTTRDLSSMEIAWAIGFPDATTMRAQAAIVGDNAFLPVADASAMYAFDLSDPDDPCVQWIYNTPGGAPLRTSASFGVTADGTPLLVFSGLDSTVHAVDARTGKAVWTKGVGVYSYSLTTGTPTVLADRVIVPVAQYEISVAADNATLCCTNHGYVLSLDPMTGAQQWRYDTMEDATHQRDRGDGQSLMGPSGAPIWNSPSVDVERGLIYFGTGESNSPPVHRNTNALIAISLETGEEVWSHQATDRDIFNSGCGPNPPPERLNCVSDTVYRDVDFGASLILADRSDGSDVIVAGQKSGSVWALEPETGEVIWRTSLGTGGPLGGVHWGIAYADDTVFAPISSPGRPIPGEWEGDPDIQPGIYALDARNGSIKWSFNPQADCSNVPAAQQRRCARSTAMSGAPTVIDGVLIAGSLGGQLYGLDAKTGEMLWKVETDRPFETLNGVEAKGGAIDAASIVAVNGVLLVNSGYGMFGQTPGNVMLALKPAAN